MASKTTITIVSTLSAVLVTVLVVGGLVAWSGVYDVSARSLHPEPVAWLLHFVMKRSVAHEAAQLQVPNLDDPALIAKGAAHFMSGCASCHGAPGQVPSPIARSLYPTPPPLYSAAAQFSPSELFWIVRNGIKMTAMPSWPVADRDDEIWPMVAFIEKLPGLKTADYLNLAGQLPPTQFLPQSAMPGFVVAQCSRCHGADGGGRGGIFPKLTGLSSSQIETDLKAYRDGDRKSGFMQPVVADMSDEAIKQAADYYAGLASSSGDKPGGPSVSGQTASP
ncbi:MAG: c-type cytochrome [Devosia sp.]